jgi:hypothetical protein
VELKKRHAQVYRCEGVIGEKREKEGRGREGA